MCILAIAFQSCEQKTEEVEEEVVEKMVPTFDLEAAKAEIEEANVNFAAFVAAGDSVGLANSYTVDAQFMSAGAPAVKGRASIQSAMSGIIQSGITGVDIRIEEVYGTEDLLAEVGELTLFVGDDAVAIEKYIVLWKKEDGRWKLFRDIFNSNMPVE
ncbi:MAG: ketosteroid isomerase-like protein [Cryomorphaceae bacterium]|jgi:ketosteroid isomerase-like protein